MYSFVCTHLNKLNALYVSSRKKALKTASRNQAPRPHLPSPSQDTGSIPHLEFVNQEQWVCVCVCLVVFLPPEKTYFLRKHFLLFGFLVSIQATTSVIRRWQQSSCLHLLQGGGGVDRTVMSCFCRLPLGAFSYIPWQEELIQNSNPTRGRLKFREIWLT